MEDEQFTELSKKLDMIIRLLASNLLQGKNLTRQAVLLSEIGLERKEIALILNKHPDLIRATLYQAKKSKRTEE
jgi:hypothetical protein